jgi:hypothetical protein
MRKEDKMNTSLADSQFIWLFAANAPALRGEPRRFVANTAHFSFGARGQYLHSEIFWQCS